MWGREGVRKQKRFALLRWNSQRRLVCECVDFRPGTGSFRVDGPAPRERGRVVKAGVRPERIEGWRAPDSGL